MRVFHVITRLIVGGAQENTIASVLGLRSEPGIDVRLISGPTTGPEGSLETMAGTGSSLQIVPDLVRPVDPWKDFKALSFLTALFRQEKPDIVHTHSGKAGILGRLAGARAGIPVIIHTIHGPSFGRFQGRLANLVFRNAERIAGRMTTHFVTVADAMRDQYLGAGIGTPGQYTTVYSGFDLQPFLNSTNDPHLRVSLGLKPEDFVIGKVARLFHLKGHEDLFRIAPVLVSTNPKARFLLVGDGPLRQRFEQRLRVLGLADRFVFAGLVPPEKVPALMGIMDVLVHLSRREGLARALPQALATARPVVSYDLDGAREVCLDSRTGFLVPVGDLHSLQEKLTLLASDAGLRKRFGLEGREFVRSRFTTLRMVNDLHALYLRLLAHKSQRD